MQELVAKGSEGVEDVLPVTGGGDESGGAESVGADRDGGRGDAEHGGEIGGGAGLLADCAQGCGSEDGGERVGTTPVASGGGDDLVDRVKEDGGLAWLVSEAEAVFEEEQGPDLEAEPAWPEDAVGSGVAVGGVGVTEGVGVEGEAA